ncbi:MAG: hypothetical protein WEA99_10485 [Brumimicrobium sp.]
MTISKEIFTGFPDDSRVWLYQTNRPLTNNETEIISKSLEEFIQEWAAHGNKLWGDAAVINPYFVAIAVNDKLTPPSGCSIDASVKKMKELGELVEVDFFTRMKIAIDTESGIQQIDFNELKDREDIDAIKIYDPLMSSLGEIRNNWPTRLAKSNFKQLV